MLMILAAVLGFVLVASVGFAFVGNDDSSSQALKRAQTFGQNKVGAGKARANVPQTQEQRRKQILLQLKEADRKERKARVTLTARLQHAGLSMKPGTFWIISGVLALVMTFIVFILGAPWFVWLMMPVIFGLGLPRWVVGFLAKRRMNKFSSHFADAVDIIVRGIKSGLPVHDCLKVIAQESPAPLGPEFQRLVENIGVGLGLEQALEKMYERMPTPELKFFSIVISIQAKSGGNLAEALGNLSTVLRARKLMSEKIKALASEATASAGIIGSLPPVVMTLVLVTTPDYMMVMFTDARGQIMLMGSGLWMSAGIFVMRRMINFKF